MAAARGIKAIRARGPHTIAARTLDENDSQTNGNADSVKESLNKPVMPAKAGIP